MHRLPGDAIAPWDQFVALFMNLFHLKMFAVCIVIARQIIANHLPTGVETVAEVEVGR